MESSLLDRVWIESAWRQEDFGLFSLRLFRSYVKVDSVDMLKFTYTHKFECLVLVFRLTGFGFHVKR